MKTIRQNVEVNFHCVEIEDAIVIEPLMTELARTIEHNKAVEIYNGLSEEEKGNYSRIWKENGTINANLAEQIYEVLSKLGYCTIHEVPCAYDILEEHRK